MTRDHRKLEFNEHAPSYGEPGMKSDRAFKRPTIKDTNRAYVRLFEYIKTPDQWLSFLARYSVVNVPYGMKRNGDCAVRVIDPTSGSLAVLGLELPNEIKYHTYVATARNFWTEGFTSATHQRNRVLEVGCAQPRNDDVVPR
ncbi:conserved hypothetical protein [Cupriavidus taiwanensis]|nr:conserved hypothetical protein [Cupriavidus taiwanensis]SOY84907.1 conserved hypothetical protein [Cupriavidus taiwanensis]